MQFVYVSKVTANVAQAVQHTRRSYHDGVARVGLLVLLEVASNLVQHGLCVLQLVQYICLFELFLDG